MKLIYTLGLALCAVTSLTAQTYYGKDVFPDGSIEIPAPLFYGEANDFSGGYDVGDVVGNFQAYTPQGETFRLSDMLENGKYTIVSTGSASCIRFFQAFNSEATDAHNINFKNYALNHQEDFNWLFVYGFEAHPGDLENCTSNCPNITIPAPNGDTLYQHQTYQDRLDAITLWKNIVDNPAFTFDMPFPMVADNPDNRIYNNFFERPFGCVVIDCEGIVIARGDWTATWFGIEGGIEFMDNLLAESPECEGSPYECADDSEDTDEDGICNDQELWQGWDPSDPDSPYETTVTSIESENLSPIHVYPNPVRDQLNISGLDINDRITIMTAQGTIISEHLAQQNNLILDTNALIAGTYIIRVFNVEAPSNGHSTLIIKQ